MLSRLLVTVLLAMMPTFAFGGLIEGPIAGFPSNPPIGTSRIATNGANDADCTVGGPANRHVLCTWDGAAWVPGGGGGGAIGFGATFPDTPTAGDLFLVTDDSATGACDSDAGSAVTLCRWDGADWLAINIIPEADTLSSVVSRGRIVTTANSFGNGVSIRDENNDGYTIYTHATGGPTIVCVDNGVEGACPGYVRKLGAGQIAGFQNSSGTDIMILTESTGALTNTKLDASVASNVVTVRFYWDMDFCAVSPVDGTTVAHVWNEDPLSSTPTPTAVVGTNRGTCWINFPDSDGTYGIQITKQLPDGFVANSLGADIIWNTTGTGNARFQLATKCYADDAADDAEFNTATITTAAAGTSGRPNKQNVATIDTTGCNAGDLIRMRFFRARTEASDTLTAALNVEKITFKGWDAQ